MSFEASDVNIARKLLSIYDNADRRGIDCTLSFAHLKRLSQRKTCYYTGRKFDDQHNKRSLERVDNNDGYHDYNTVYVCKQANRLKDNMSLKELDNMVKAIKKFRRKNLD